jgi:ketosteroid isomerase-like protein
MNVVVCKRIIISIFEPILLVVLSTLETLDDIFIIYQSLTMKNLFSNFISPCYFLLIIVSSISCQDSHSSIPKDKEAIKQTLTAMWDAIEKEDIERYASYIHPDFTQFGETDTVLRVGKESEVNGIRSWIQESSNIHTEMIDPIVTVKGNTAWIVYYWKDHGTTNGKPFATRGKSTRIFVKENDRWLCIHGHYTLLP